MFRAEDEQDACAATRAKAEQAAELAEFDEGIPYSEEAGKVSYHSFHSYIMPYGYMYLNLFMCIKFGNLMQVCPPNGWKTFVKTFKIIKIFKYTAFQPHLGS